MQAITPAQLDDWLKQAGAQTPGVMPVVLDVREPWELQTASVRTDGFELVAIPMGELPGRLSELDPSRPLACLCHHGVRSLHVAVFLDQQGFETLANITGGIDAWSRERDTSVPRY